jgi:hypothetical protein
MRAIQKVSSAATKLLLLRVSVSNKEYPDVETARNVVSPPGGSNLWTLKKNGNNKKE